MRVALTPLLITVVLATGCSSKPPMTHNAAVAIGQLVGVTVACKRERLISKSSYTEYGELIDWLEETWTDTKEDVALNAAKDIARYTADIQVCNKLHTKMGNISNLKWRREQASTAENWDTAWKVLDLTISAASLAAELAPVKTNCSEFMGDVSCTSYK